MQIERLVNADGEPRLVFAKEPQTPAEFVQAVYAAVPQFPRLPAHAVEYACVRWIWVTGADKKRRRTLAKSEVGKQGSFMISFLGAPCADWPELTLPAESAEPRPGKAGAAPAAKTDQTPTQDGNPPLEAKSGDSEPAAAEAEPAVQASGIEPTAATDDGE
jgi:hypothetical protein